MLLTRDVVGVDSAQCETAGEIVEEERGVLILLCLLLRLCSRAPAMIPLLVNSLLCRTHRPDSTLPPRAMLWRITKITAHRQAQPLSPYRGSTAGGSIHANESGRAWDCSLTWLDLSLSPLPALFQGTAT